MVEFFHIKRWEKSNRTNFYWVMLLRYTAWEHWNILSLEIFCKYVVILTLDIVKKSLWISSQFDRNFFMSYFRDICRKIYIWKFLKLFFELKCTNTIKPKNSLRGYCANTPELHITLIFIAAPFRPNLLLSPYSV